MTIITPSWEEIKARFSCESHVIQIRRRVWRNGQVTWWEQCTRCGDKFRQIKNAEVPPSAAASPVDFDESLYDTRYKLALATYNQAREEARDAASKQWWARYNEYLRSPEWAKRREKVLRRAGGVCEGCAEAKAIQVHHKTYDHVFHEPLWDLVAVCRECHEALHARGAA